MVIGPIITLEDLLRDGYKAIFIGTGVWSPKPLRIKGETLGTVHYAINYLKILMLFFRQASVCYRRREMWPWMLPEQPTQGAEEVTVLYRRGEENMSATKYEYEYAKLDGVAFQFYTTPLEILDDGYSMCQNSP